MSKRGHRAKAAQKLFNFLSHHSNIQFLHWNLDANDLVLADHVNPPLNLQQFVHSHVWNQVRRNSLIDIHTNQETILQQQGIALTLQVPIQNIQSFSGTVLFCIDVAESPRRNLIEVQGIPGTCSEVLQHLIPGRVAKVE